MSQRPPPPAAHRLSSAIDGSEALSQLLRRLQDARARFNAVTALIPDTLLADVRAGPVDGTSWTLLAANNAAAAKLRQLLPVLQRQLDESGWQGSAIKVRVQPRDRN